MSNEPYALKLPPSLMNAAQRLANEDGVSLDEWIALAVAQKIGAVETAAEFLKRRAGSATGDGLKWFVENAPDVSPVPEDELPPEYLRR